MRGLVLFLIGILVGFVIMTVWACIIVGAEADERDRQMFEKHIKEKENDE